MAKFLGTVQPVLIPSNASLLQRCVDGDQTAWSTLISRYESLVYSIPIREGLDRDAAADIAQYTFTELMRCLQAIREPERLSHWLVVVCRREVWRRKAKTQPTLELREERLESIPDFAESYASAAALHDTIQALGEPCRSLILGLFYDPEEPDYAAMAIQLGRPVGSIGPMRGRCLDQLRKILRSEAIDA